MGSIDCTHWQWKNCPIAWQGMYQDRKHKRSIVVEAICGHDMYFYQVYVGLPRSCRILIATVAQYFCIAHSHKVWLIRTTLTSRLARRLLMKHGCSIASGISTRTLSTWQGWRRRSIRHTWTRPTWTLSYRAIYDKVATISSLKRNVNQPQLEPNFVRPSYETQYRSQPLSFGSKIIIRTNLPRVPSSPPLCHRHYHIRYRYDEQSI